MEQPGSTAGAMPMAWRRTWVGDRPAFYGVAGEGMPAVFLHGWGLANHAYREALEELVALGCRVWAPALPGFGGTPELPRRDFSLAGYARWLSGFIDAIGLSEPAFLIGHSFGGGVAIRYGHEHPGRVRTLVLVNSIGGSAWRTGTGRLKSMADRPLWDWGLHFPGDVWPIPQATRVIPVMLADAIPNVLRNPRAVYKAATLARKADLRHELEELKARGMPVVVLWGKRDGIIPRESFEALCAAVGVEGRVVEGSHSWMLADPQVFGEVMTNVVEVARLARAAERPSDARHVSEHGDRHGTAAEHELDTLAGGDEPTSG